MEISEMGHVRVLQARGRSLIENGRVGSQDQKGDGEMIHLDTVLRHSP